MFVLSLKEWTVPLYENNLDPFHKRLPILHSFVNIEIRLTKLVFEFVIKKNFNSQTRFKGIQKNV